MSRQPDVTEEEVLMMRKHALHCCTYTIFLFQDGTNDVVVDTAHQYQVISFVQFDANVSFSFAIHDISLKKQVNRAYEDGISEDENTESVPKVKEYLSLYPLIALF